jgi:hypothetical protein
MATYTNRTCHKCGIRKPQPEMHQIETYVETGKSKSGVSGATFIGTVLGDQKSANSVNRWLFNTNQRTYKRKRTAWSCGPCAKKEKNLNSTAEIFSAIIVGSIVLFFYLMFSAP